LSLLIHAAHEPDVSFGHAIYMSLFGCMDCCCDQMTDSWYGVRRLVYNASKTVPNALSGILPKIHQGSNPDGRMNTTLCFDPQDKTA
jgi:adenylate cyclase